MAASDSASAPLMIYPVALDADARDYLLVLEQLAAGHGDAVPTMDDLRELYVDQVRLQRGGIVPDDLPDVQARALQFTGAAGEIRCIEFTPRDAALALDTVVFLHGGGWAVGSPELYSPDTQFMCQQLGARVISIDYRLAPEHPYPAALEDALAVVRAVHEAGGHRTLSIAGDSAGGNIAAAVAHSLRGSEVALNAQLLMYPSLDEDRDQYASLRENAEGYLLTREVVAQFRAFYCSPDSGPSLARPATAESLDGLPPAVVATAGFDPLRDEGKAYAARLVAAGVETHYVNFPSLIHGFLTSWPNSPAATEAIRHCYRLFSAVLDRSVLDRSVLDRSVGDAVS
jgi:acetyl esterase